MPVGFMPTGGLYVRARVGGKRRGKSVDIDARTVAARRLSDSNRTAGPGLKRTSKVRSGRVPLGEAGRALLEQIGNATTTPGTWPGFLTAFCCGWLQARPAPRGGGLGRMGATASILRRHRLSGLSLPAFARKHGLCWATLLRWRWEGQPADARPVAHVRLHPG